MPSQEQLDATAVASEGVAQSVPLVTQVTAADVGREELDAAAVASDVVA